MEKLLREVENSYQEAEKTKELYELLSTYNAYITLLMKAKSNYEDKKIDVRKYYSNDICYRKRVNDLFKLFKSNENLEGQLLKSPRQRDLIFLIDQETLLKIKNSENFGTSLLDCNIDYSLLRIDDCICKIFEESIYHRDPYYCESYYEDEEAFGLVSNKKLITPSYKLEEEHKDYEDKDIREVLKPQSIDEVLEKITEAKEEKVKQLVLTRKY